MGLALGLPGAYLLARYEFPGRRTLRSPTLVPFVLSAIIGPVGFASMFGGAQVVRDRDGTLSGATEPRKDGTVAAY